MKIARSSRINLRHGLLERELMVSAAEKPEFKALQRVTCAYYLPETPLQVTACDAIVVCEWRLKLLLRSEAYCLSQFLQSSGQAQPEPDMPEGDPGRLSWYLSGGRYLNNTIRFLTRVIQDFQVYGYVRPLWKDDLERCFGGGFYENVSEWTVSQLCTLQLAQTMTAQNESFGWTNPCSSDEESLRIVADPKQTSQYVQKLFDQQLQQASSHMASGTAQESAHITT